MADWNDVKPSHAFQRGVQVVVYLPVRAAQPARVGRGATRASTVIVTSKRGGGVVKTSTGKRRGKGGSAQVAREKRGGTPSKKKR